jgi:hypothetical protein
MSFSRKPRPLGSLRLKAGTARADQLTSTGGEAAFGGAGADIITGIGSRASNGWLLASFMVGGKGNDTYGVQQGSFCVISDQGGGRDTVDLSALSANSTFFVSLDKGCIGITDGTTLVAIEKPFSGSKTAIENVVFYGRSWTPRQLYSYGVERKASLGSTTFADLERAGYLDFSLVGLSSSSTGLDSVISATSFNSAIVI